MVSAPVAGSPRVTMGMPIFNGGDYLEEALQSLLTQTFEDFELLISDNASSDRTEEICRRYAGADPRIRYHRNAENVGYCHNQNSVIEAGRGEYFLMTHHDDVRSPEFVERTIQVMDADPALVVCYTGTRDIDERGNLLPRRDPALRLDSPDPRERFQDIIRLDHFCEPDFGLIRMSALRRTRLHGDYADSDRVLLAELALQGPFRQLHECLFFRRAHAGQSTAIAPNRQARTVWFNPAHRGKLLFPHFREMRELFGVIHRAEVSGKDRRWCYREVLRWSRTYSGRMFSDLEFAAREIARPYYRRLQGRAGKDA